MGGVGGEEAKEWSKGGGEEKTTFYFQSASGCAPWRGCHRNGEEKGAGKVRAGEERSGRGGEGARGRARGCGRAPGCRRPVAHHAVAVALLPSAQLPSPRGHHPIAAVTQLPSPSCRCPIAVALLPSARLPSPRCPLLAAAGGDAEERDEGFGSTVSSWGTRGAPSPAAAEVGGTQGGLQGASRALGHRGGRWGTVTLETGVSQCHHWAPWVPAPSSGCPGPSAAPGTAGPCRGEQRGSRHPLSRFLPSLGVF